LSVDSLALVATGQDAIIAHQLAALRTPRLQSNILRLN